MESIRGLSCCLSERIPYSIRPASGGFYAFSVHCTTPRLLFQHVRAVRCKIPFICVISIRGSYLLFPFLPNLSPMQ